MSRSLSARRPDVTADPNRYAPTPRQDIADQPDDVANELDDGIDLTLFDFGQSSIA